MPNTLAHIGIQGLANAAAIPRGYLAWVLLACAIPDVPWIIRRLVRLAVGSVDPISLELYSTVQGSLALSLLLSAAVAALARRPLFVWALLAANCAFHLLLDAVEIKPGNGVHLLAPFSWEMTQLEWLWPEHWIVIAATALGLVFMAMLLSSRILRETNAPVLVLAKPRLAAAASILVAYVTLPLAMLDGPAAANSRGIQAFLTPDARVGMPIAIDRDPVVTRGDITLLLTHGEEIVLQGADVPRTGIVSLRGRFVDKETIEATEIHVNEAGLRDVFSIAGLGSILAFWLWSAARRLPRP